MQGTSATVHIRRLAAALAVATAGLLAVNGPAASAAPAAGTAKPAPAPRIVSLTNADSGTTVKAAPGTIIVVHLTATGPRFGWSAPTSDNHAVADPLISRAAQDGGAIAVFVTGRTGTTDVQAISACRPTGQVCPFLAILWRATVTVG